MFRDSDYEKIIRDIVSGKRFFGINKDDDFSLWFKVVLRSADIVEDRFSSKGFYMYPWYGLDLIKRVMGYLEGLLKCAGHKEERYPSFIPLSVFLKEKDFFEGFQGEAFLITRTLRGEKLEDPLVVRPTSETIIYPLWAVRIRNYKQLPVKVFQTVNVFRLETKAVKPLLRLREIAFFNEGHTAHRTMEETEEHIKNILEIYKEFFHELGIPYFLVKTPEWDTFPGAVYNYDFITVLPDGKCLELGSVINLGEKFSRVFKIDFTDKDGKQKYVKQTCYGVSERVVGACIALHGDERGIVLLPEFAPIQIVIVPIFYGEKQKTDVLEKCTHLKNTLEHDFRVVIDDNPDKTPGYKFHYWEMKGVPLRIEIGPRDIKQRKITIFRRDKNEKESVYEEKVKERIIEILREYKKAIREKTMKSFEKYVTVAYNLKEFREKIETQPVIIQFCGNKECSDAIKSNFNREVIGFIEKTTMKETLFKKTNNSCLICGKTAKTWALVGKTY